MPARGDRVAVVLAGLVAGLVWLVERLPEASVRRNVLVGLAALVFAVVQFLT